MRVVREWAGYFCFGSYFAGLSQKALGCLIEKVERKGERGGGGRESLGEEGVLVVAGKRFKSLF